MPPKTKITDLNNDLLVKMMKTMSLRNRVALSGTNRSMKAVFDENFKTIKYYFKKGIATKQITIDNFENFNIGRLITHAWTPRRNSGIPLYMQIAEFNFQYQEIYRGTITVHYDPRANNITPSIKFVKFQCREFQRPDNILLTLSRKKPDDFALDYKIIDHPERAPDKERVKELLFILLAGYEKCRTLLKNHAFYGENVAIPDIEHKHKYLSLYKNPKIHEIFDLTYKTPLRPTPKSSSASS